MLFPHFCLNSAGQVQAVTEGTVTDTIGGQGFVGTSPLVSDETAASDTYISGFTYSAGGALRIYDATAGLPTSFSLGAFKVTATGQLCITTDDVGSDVIYVGGIALTNDGRVYMSTGGGSSYTGPLDEVPGAVTVIGAYDLNIALTVDWLGEPLFRLKRDSDDAEMDFDADAVTGQLDAAAVTTWLDGANGTVITLYDQSGNGRDLDLAAGAPVIFSDPEFIGGKFAVYDDGEGTSSWQGDGFNITFASGACTIWLVSTSDLLVDAHTLDANSYVQIGPTGGQTLHISNLEVTPNRFAGGEIETPPDTFTFSMFDAAWEYGSRSCFVNGVSQSFSQVFDDEGPIGELGSLRLDVTLEAGAGIAGFILCDAEVADNDRVACRADYSAIYGITLP